MDRLSDRRRRVVGDGCDAWAPISSLPPTQRLRGRAARHLSSHAGYGLPPNGDRPSLLPQNAAGLRETFHPSYRAWRASFNV